MSNCYRSEYEAYHFLCDPADNLCCDFEILTDKMASLNGLLRATVTDKKIQEELLSICELLYHANPSLRTKVTLTKKEIEWLNTLFYRLREETSGKCSMFLLPQGSHGACLAHVLRSMCNEAVRMIYRHDEAGHITDPLLYDFFNLLSGYFYALALKLNKSADIQEFEFVSRNYEIDV